jgi:hypothetical protein
MAGGVALVQLSGARPALITAGVAAAAVVIITIYLVT